MCIQKESIQFDIKLGHSLMKDKRNTVVQGTEVREEKRRESLRRRAVEKEGREKRGFLGRGEEKRICPGTPENDSAGVKIIYGSHLRGCSVTVRPSLI